MSYPLCETARMQSDDTAEPIEWNVDELRSAITEWEGIAAQIIDRLHETFECAGSQNWRPHFAQIVTVVSRFRDRCREEAKQLHFWREDGLQPGEAYERVWDEADQLVAWLKRMMQD